MLTQKQVLEAVKSGKEPACLDGRDYGRLATFFPSSDWDIFGITPPEDLVVPGRLPVEEHWPSPWTRDEILSRLACDVEFGFEKALDQRGISAALMHDVIKMWLWVLEDDELYNFNEYAEYGLPLLKRVAVKYGFDNPIGEDSGNEWKYMMRDW